MAATPQFVIQTRIRRTILETLQGLRVDPAQMLWLLGTRRGFLTVGDLQEYLNQRYGERGAEEVLTRLHQFAAETDAASYGFGVYLMPTEPLNRNTIEVLLAIPDDLFVSSVELGRDLTGSQYESARYRHGAIAQFDRTVAELLMSNGVPYHFQDGRLVPSMSPLAVEASVKPAVDALDDPRLANARTHFIEALRRLEEPDPEEAVDEARMAVEEAMLALLDVSGAARPDKHQPQDIFNALVANGMPRDAEELILAAPRFRGRTKAGHAGRPHVTAEEGRAAVAAAGSALLYLAGRLP